MKNDNLFDNLEEDIESIDENTVLEDTGINYENIRSIVMKEISNKKTKRKITKRIIIGLVAAAIAITALTTTAVATGSFSSVFGEILSGESNAGLYSGGNVSVISSDDNLDMEVLGITGDDNRVYIALEVTKKDGSAFCKLQDDTFAYFDNCYYDASMPLLNSLFSGSLDIEYTCGGVMPDDKTIIYYMSLDRDVSLKGQKLSGTFNNVVICNYERLGEYATVGKDVTEELEEMNEKYKSQLNENQFICINDYGSFDNFYDCDCFEYCIRTTDRIDVEFNISLDLNYKSTTKNCNIENNTINFTAPITNYDDVNGYSYKNYNGTFTVNSASVSALGITIKGTLETEKQLKENADELLRNSLYSYDTEITMKDGTTHYMIASNYIPGANNEYTIYFNFINSTESNISTTLEPSEIEKVTINDTVITVK